MGPALSLLRAADRTPGKAESQRIWESVQAVELATMGWVHWWNTTRLHEALGYRTPTEVEAAYTHDQDVAPVAS